MWAGIGSWFLDLWDKIFDGLKIAGEYIINLLPSSPFTALSNVDVSGYMAWLNWLIPIGQMVAILEVWGAAILVYYIYVTILRWVKAIQ